MRATEIAAMILTGNPANDGLLHHELYAIIERVGTLTIGESIDIKTAVVIATIVWWERTNPFLEAIGD